MSIRALAKDLYKAQQSVDQLQKKIEAANPGEKIHLEGELKLAVQDRDLLRRMLDGEKESGNFRKRFDGFGSTRS